MNVNVNDKRKKGRKRKKNVHRGWSPRVCLCDSIGRQQKKKVRATPYTVPDRDRHDTRAFGTSTYRPWRWDCWSSVQSRRGHYGKYIAPKAPAHCRRRRQHTRARGCARRRRRFIFFVRQVWCNSLESPPTAAAAPPRPATHRRHTRTQSSLTHLPAHSLTRARRARARTHARTHIPTRVRACARALRNGGLFTAAFGVLFAHATISDGRRRAGRRQAW